MNISNDTKQIFHFFGKAYFDAVFPAKVIFHKQLQKKSIWHDHDFYELVLVISGNGFNKTLQRKVPIKNGYLLLLKPGEAHSYQIEGESILLVNLLIKADFLNDNNLSALFENVNVAENIIQLTSNSSTYKRLLSNLQLMKEESESSNQFNKEIFESMLRETLYITSRSFNNCPPNDKNSKHAELISNYIAENLDKKPQLDEIAKLTGTNASYISRNFKNITGYKFVELVNEHRIHKVCDSLVNTDADIDEIYRNSGYKNKVYFHRAFKRTTGLSPLQYRKQFNNN